MSILPAPVRLAALSVLLAAASCMPSESAPSEGPPPHQGTAPERAAGPAPGPLDPIPPALQGTIPPEQLVLSSELVRAARAVEGVHGVARVALGNVSTTTDVGEADITVIAVDPAQFRALAPAVTAHADFVWRGLSGKQVFLAHEEYRRLGAEPGSTVFLRGPSAAGSLFRIGGVASNGIPNLGGAMISLTQAGALGLGPPNHLLVSVERGRDPSEVRAALAEFVPTVRFDLTAAAGRRALVVGEEAVRLFGTFTYTVNPDGTIVPDGEWVRRHIVSRSVPILGTVSCHRVMFPQLEGALREIVERGLSHTINPRDYGGCYNARLIRGTDPSDPHSPLSMHAWGLALDINVSTNQMGAQPTQDPEMVAVFERWGFRWGGRWSRPDGMHFELAALLRS